MSLSKEECHELFVFFNDKEAVPSLVKSELEKVKENMDAGLVESLRKLVGLFKDVEELILVKIFCQNRGNL